MPPENLYNIWIAPYQSGTNFQSVNIPPVIYSMRWPARLQSKQKIALI